MSAESGDKVNRAHTVTVIDEMSWEMRWDEMCGSGLNKRMCMAERTNWKKCERGREYDEWINGKCSTWEKCNNSELTNVDNGIWIGIRTSHTSTRTQWKTKTTNELITGFIRVYLLLLFFFFSILVVWFDGIQRMMVVVIVGCQREMPLCPEKSIQFVNRRINTWNFTI